MKRSLVNKLPCFLISLIKIFLPSSQHIRNGIFEAYSWQRHVVTSIRFGKNLW